MRSLCINRCADSHAHRAITSFKAEEDRSASSLTAASTRSYLTSIFVAGLKVTFKRRLSASFFHRVNEIESTRRDGVKKIRRTLRVQGRRELLPTKESYK